MELTVLATLIANTGGYAKGISIVQESPHHCEYPNGFSVGFTTESGARWSCGGHTIEEAVIKAVDVLIPTLPPLYPKPSAIPASGTMTKGG